MIVFRLIIFMLFISVHQCRLPDKVYCVNEQCNTPISKAKTLLAYNSADEDLMSFRANADALIFMKSAGTNPDLWYARIDGKTGFVSTKFIRETKIIEKNPQYVIPIEVRTKKPEVQVKPDKVLQGYEVVDGTTIYTGEPGVSDDTSTTVATPNVQETSTPVLPTEDKLNSDLNNDKNTPTNKAQVSFPTEATSTETPVTTSKPSSTPEVVQPVTTEPPLSSSTSAPATEPSSVSVDQVTLTTERSTEEISTEPVSDNEQLAEQVNKGLPEPLPTAQSLSSIDVPPLQLQVPESIEKKPDIKDNVESNVSTETASNIDTLPQIPEETVNNVPAIQNPPEVLNEDKKTENIENGPETAPKLTDLNGNGFFGTTFDQNGNIVNYPNTSQTDDESNDLPAETSLASSNTVKQPDDSDYIHATEITTKTPQTYTLPAETPHTQNNEAPITEATPKRSEVPIYDTQSYLTTETPVTQNSQAPEVTKPTTKSSEVPTYDTQSYLTTETPVTQNSQAPEVTKPTTKSSEVPTYDTQSYLTTETPVTQNSQAPEVTKPTTKSSEVPTYDTQSYLTIETPVTQNSEAPVTEPSTISSEVPTYDTQSYLTTESPVTQNSEIPDISKTTTQNEEIISDIYSTTTASTLEPDYIYTPSYNPSHSSEETNDYNMATETKEEGEGVISKMFTAISDLWPSTTESSIPEVFDSESEVPQIENTSEVKEEDGFSFTSYLLSKYGSLMGSVANEETKALFASVGETCFTDEYCDGAATRTYNRFLMFMLTTASSILLFILGYYYIDNRRQDAKFIGNINALQRDLLFSQKECEILKEELSATKTKLVGIEDNRFGMDDMVQSLREEINELKAQNERLRHSLDDNEKLLRVSENTAGELQNTLGEVENTLSELLAERASSEEQIAELNGKVQAFEEELISVSRDRDNFQLKYVSAETALEESKKQKKQLEDLNEKLKEAKSTIDLQRHEVVALKDALKELKGGSGNVDVGSLIDHTEIKAKLAKALEERKNFEAKYEIELKERGRLSEGLSTAQEALRTTTAQANEASTRLEVLGKYFQEREGELMKELSAKESLWLSKQGESASTVEKMDLLQQEIQRFKEKCDALTLELAEQESSRRTAIAEVEARAHTAWLEARAAKREADAARDDAAALRRKLAAMSAADGAASPHRQMSSPLEATDGVLPPPLPLLPFLPPPLLPPLPRPPPLGRLPSPHPPRYNDRRYSPDSRYSPSSRYSPETVRYSPDSRYSPRRRSPSPYSPRRRRSRSRERYNGSRPRNGPPDTETEYNSDASPPRYSRRSGQSGPSSGSGCSSESDK